MTAQLTHNSQLISLVIPCHNEAGNIEPLYLAIKEVLTHRLEPFEIIFVDDGSSDGTPSMLRELAGIDERVHVIELVRNFGKEIAITAGLNHASGTAAICLDADLQHPPALIPELLARWREGAEVVVGVRQTGRKHAPLLKRMGSGLFYKLMNAVTDVKIVAHATDYRLIDRVVIDEFNRFTEHNRITRGLIDWIGFRRAYVEFTPARRYAGEAAYSYIKLISLALNSFVSMSLFPLRAAGYLGLIIMLTSGPLGLFILIEKYLMHDPWHLNISGPAILAVIILFMVGIILVSLGLMALYVATIHTEVLNRPLYIARREGGRRPLYGHVVTAGTEKRKAIHA